MAFDKTTIFKRCKNIIPQKRMDEFYKEKKARIHYMAETILGTSVNPSSTTIFLKYNEFILIHKNYDIFPHYILCFWWTAFIFWPAEF